MERGDISGGGETKQNNSGQQQQQPQPPAQQCPRCESVNTKFCYYNNYSLSQPRYFCKTCRRYWTQGGTLRNVPVGGGCRKGKRAKTTPSSATASPPSITTTTPPSTLQNHHQFLSSSNLPHHQSQYMMSGVGSTNPGLGSFYPGTAGFLNSLAAIPNQSLITGSTSSNLGFGAVTAPPFPATQYFGSNNYPRQEENLMMSFPNWQRSEEEYDVRATAAAAAVAGGSRNMVPETALWSISTSTTTGESVRAEEGKNDNAGGGSSLMNGLQDDRRWNHGGGGGGGQLPGYGPS